MTVSTLVEPAYCSVPAYTRTLGPEVAGIAELAGFAPDPEQRLALDAIFALNPLNKATALEAAIIASRQNIKTGLFKQCALGWLFVTDQQLIVWSAHEFSTSQEAHRDLTELIEGSDALRKRVKHIHRGNGEEAIELVTGQRVKFKARTKTGGRGLSGDKIVLDEAFALEPTHMGSLFPLLSVRPDPQVVYGSSAGLATSSVLRSIRDRGRPGGDPRLIYIEWCDDLPGECQTEDCDHSLTAVGCRLDDERRWARSNTQLGRRMTYEYVRAERRALPPAEFARERLGWWDEPEGAAKAAIDRDTWVACAEPGSEIVGKPVLAVSMTPDRTVISVVAAGKRPDGLLHVETVLHGSPETVTAEETVRVAKRNGATLVLHPGHAAGSLLPDLNGVRVKTLTSGDYTRACGAFYDLVRAQGVRYVAPQPELDEAVSRASRKFAGDSWRWQGDGISALVAASQAVFAAQTAPQTSGSGRVIALN